MSDYTGKAAKNYTSAPGNVYMMHPAILRAIPKAKKISTLLDAGCGNGEGYQLVKKLGYKYSGFDISKDMIKQAENRFPEGNFKIASAFDFSSSYREKFDVIISMMVFPTFSKKSNLIDTLKECRKSLKKDGKIIIGTGHPCFDAYMRSKFGWRDNVKTNFQGYFKGGQKYTVKHEFDGKIIIFNDYHWTLADYVDAIISAGLKLVKIDECPPVPKPGNSKYVKENSIFPHIIVLIATK